MRRLAMLVVGLGLVGAVGCKKAGAETTGAGESRPATNSDKGSSPPAPAAVSDKGSAKAAPPETAWVKKFGAQPVAGAPAPISTPRGETKKENKYGWSSSTGPMYFYKMPLDELRGSVLFLLARDGFTIESTRNIGSIEVLTVVKGGERVSVSFAEQITTKLAFVGFRKPM